VGFINYQKIKNILTYIGKLIKMKLSTRYEPEHPGVVKKETKRGGTMKC